MKIVDCKDLRLNLKKWLSMVVDDMEELIIKRKNQNDLVLISLDKYNVLKETSYLLRGKYGEVLLKSIKEAQKGEVKEEGIIE